LNRATGGARAALRFAGDVSGGIPRAPLRYFYSFKFRHLVKFLFFHTMDLQTLSQKSIELHRKFKTIEAQLKAANADLLDAMVAENVSTIKVKQRTVSLVTRNIKDFGDDINQQELLLKAEKKRREVLGQFTIASTSQSIRIN
jgi:hypothetical protein